MKILRCPRCDTFTDWATADVTINAPVRMTEEGEFHLELDKDDLESLSGRDLEDVKPMCDDCGVAYQIVERSEDYVDHIIQRQG